MKSVLAIALLSSVLAGTAMAKGSAPEDFLAGKVIVSDKPLPMSWKSASSYASQLKSLNKGTIWYDKKTKKVTVQFAAFFSRPLNDVQVSLVIWDITNGAHDNKGSFDNYMNRGDRVLFNSVTLSDEDFPMNKKYLFAVQSRGQTLASGSFILRGDAEKFSGQVTFTDEETKKKE